jgi:hypothetical protein
MEVVGSSGMGSSNIPDLRLTQFKRASDHRIEDPTSIGRSLGHPFQGMAAEATKSGNIITLHIVTVIKSLLSFLFAALVFVQVPQWDNDWTKCSVSVPDTACHWYVVNPDNTFGKGFSWITAPTFDVAALNDIGAQHELTISQGYQTTVELMNANSNIKYGDDY